MAAIKHTCLILLLCHGLVLVTGQQIENNRPRVRRGILGKWFGAEKTEALQSTVYHHQQPQVLSRVQTVNQQVPHYPIWKVHKYNGINLKPLPVSMVPSMRSGGSVGSSVQIPPRPQFVGHQERISVNQPATVKLLEQQPIVVVDDQRQQPPPSSSGVSQKTEEDIRGIMKLLGVSDASQVPSIHEVMDMLGASTPEEAVDTVKEIAATEEGISLIKSFIESRQTPEDEGIIEVITQSPTTTTTTPTTTTTSTSTTVAPPTSTITTSSPSATILAQKPFQFPWSHSPKNVINAATAKVASRLDNLHTNAHLLNKILPNTDSSSSGQSAFRNTLRNIKNFFTFQDNTPIPLEKYSAPVAPPTVVRKLPKVNAPTVVYVNEPIPATSIDLPALPQLTALPELNAVRNVPQMPKLPQIQLPSHFSVPQRVVQGPYMKVQYPVASLAPLPMFRQRPLYTYRGQPISNAPPAPTTSISSSKSSYDVPVYGVPSVTSAEKSNAQPVRIPFNQSTRDAFQNAPQIISSLPVPTLPYAFGEQQQPQVEDHYTAAENSPVESVVALEEELMLNGGVGDEERGAVEGELASKDETSTVEEELVKEGADEEHETREKDDNVATAVAAAPAAPQRLSGYSSYATGKVHRATNVDILQHKLTNGEKRVAESADLEGDDV